LKRPSQKENRVFGEKPKEVSQEKSKQWVSGIQSFKEQWSRINNFEHSSGTEVQKPLDYFLTLIKKKENQPDFSSPNP
jgi:hypothetical protein